MEAHNGFSVAPTEAQVKEIYRLMLPFARSTAHARGVKDPEEFARDAVQKSFLAYLRTATIERAVESFILYAVRLARAAQSGLSDNITTDDRKTLRALTDAADKDTTLAALTRRAVRKLVGSPFSVEQERQLTAMLDTPLVIHSLRSFMYRAILTEVRHTLEPRKMQVVSLELIGEALDGMAVHEPTDIDRALDRMLLERVYRRMSLSKRAIVDRVAHGCSDAEIGASLGIRPDSVREQLQRLRRENRQWVAATSMP